MESSQSLLTAQIHFLDTNLALIHIPLHLYSYFLQPMLQLVLPAESSADETTDEAGTNDDVTRPKRPWVFDYPFVNVSVTPVECSVACSIALAERLFKPIRAGLDQEQRKQVSISHEEYVVIQVDGEGLDAGQRVVELSSPLAMNGISIFFYSTYFSDYILVPQRSRAAVISALEERGFAFSKESEGFVNVSSPLVRPRSGHRGSVSTTSLSDTHESYFPGAMTSIESRPPSTPPPSSVPELETRTFNTLKRRQVVPTVDPTIQLVQCAGRKDTLRGGSGAHSTSAAVKHRLQLGLVKCLTTMPRPRFFSLTLTDTEPASLLLEKRLLINFEAPQADGAGASDDIVLLGNKNDILTPITFDLRELPMESTGIVCGIAGRLVGTATSRPSSKEGDVQSPVFEPGDLDTIEMSYLSTARAGTVIIAQEEIQTALDALKGDDAKGINGLPVEWLQMKSAD